MKTLGICFGASTIQYVFLHNDDGVNSVTKTLRIPHNGNPKKVFIDSLKPADLIDIEKIAITGRNISTNINLSSIPEPKAVEYALKAEYKDKNFPDLLVSMGGENQVVYKINSLGEIETIHTGSKCASGTGEFFLQQIRRMDLDINDGVSLAQKGKPIKLASRCSVFCKSDCTHALNKGEKRENIVAGLSVMMADKIIELIKDISCETLSVIGGGALNTATIDALGRKFPNISIPENATFFEAYGAALWAINHECISMPKDLNKLFNKTSSAFEKHTPLFNATHLVDVKNAKRGKIKPNDVCILGLDVGSTTTKAVLIRKDDKEILADIYLKTNGQPIEASKQCYKSILEQIGNTPHSITSFGITGSGRQIVALHALTPNVINEIIAHAAGAAHFDKEVDTIFEIGGQDAKYIHLTEGVPSDYAMNEACSAGTGSFIEESAIETLGVKAEDIAQLALKADAPPNFNDQCAAFISSDIKQAGQEGINRDNILAGLVYSICLNYLNRVKGTRPIGKKIFMQGGVCYNKAIPIAMASLMNTKIIVPPDPGLLGAYGVAIELANRLDNNIIKPSSFNLSELINRKSESAGTFTCMGTKEKCDRKCTISRFRINGKLYAFGGACDKYYNLRLNKKIDTKEFDLTALRQKLLFGKYAPKKSRNTKTIGITTSFLTHQLYPLFSNFFDKIGLKTILPDKIDSNGIMRAKAAFCMPAEVAHGSFYSLLNQNLDYIFLPHITQLPIENVPTFSRACVFVQAEPYYLKSTFRNEIEQNTASIISPVLKLETGYKAAEPELIAIALKLGVSKKQAQKAFNEAYNKQINFEKELLSEGKKALEYLDKNPDKIGIIVFGRPYNAFPKEVNMGIPHKFASRGFITIPFDMLDSSKYDTDKKMFWAMGQKIMKTAQLVKSRNNLFGVYVTNYSCGPDSFILGYFRSLMGAKPSLTLEIDRHTADAGIDTRIEAALDIMNNYRINKQPKINKEIFTPAKVEEINGETFVISSENKRYKITDKENVELVLPSMGKFGTEALAAILKKIGINAIVLPIANKNSLLEGRKNSTSKECLPYHVTTGSFLKYLEAHPNRNKVTLCFLATGGGPCRLGQYAPSFSQTIKRLKIPNVAVFTLTDENSYSGLGTQNMLSAWKAIITSDIFSEIKSMLSVSARNKKEALATLENLWQECLEYFESSNTSTRFTYFLKSISKRLSKIPLKSNPKDIPVVSLVGEIFVRHDEFSRGNIVEYLEKNGFMVKISPVSEFLWYSNYVTRTGLSDDYFTFLEKIKIRLSAQIQSFWEKKIKTIFSESGLYKFEMIEIEKTMNSANHLINENYRGECILTVGTAMREIIDDSCGVIALSPLGCGHSRTAEAILNNEMNIDGKKRIKNSSNKLYNNLNIKNFPFLTLETDGNPFPQIVETKLEAFVIQAKRTFEKLSGTKQTQNNTTQKIKL